ncbi:MAG TPA: tripartite tricarboxylate transporter substrate binding protein, partial [Burkholderiales bacterium]|nr:tripartite tricarboxylate transporter substrate binding protein [Burkholderiales bacterium]
MNRHLRCVTPIVAALALGMGSGAVAQTTHSTSSGQASTGRHAEADPFTLRLAQGERGTQSKEQGVRSRTLEASGRAYPTKPVRMVLGYPPGGGIDVLARIMAPKLSERWGEQVVVDNRPGASGNIGAEIVAKAAPDGYTLLMMTLSHAVGAGLYPRLPFHPADSFSGVTLIGATTLVLLSQPSSSMKTVKDVIAAAKAKPGQLSFGSSGIGGSPHLAGELLKLQTGIDIVHVPYKGSGLAFTDLMGGHVPLLMSALPGALPHVKSGKMRAIGVTSMQRSPAVPEVPTIAESGVPGYEVRHWFGALSPAGTDREVLERLHD